jgi:hypothetical protein
MYASVFVCLVCDEEFKISASNHPHDVAFCPFCAEPIDGEESFDVEDDTPPCETDEVYEE